MGWTDPQLPGPELVGRVVEVRGRGLLPRHGTLFVPGHLAAWHLEKGQELSAGKEHRLPAGNRVLVYWPEISVDWSLSGIPDELGTLLDSDCHCTLMVVEAARLLNLAPAGDQIERAAVYRYALPALREALQEVARRYGEAALGNLLSHEDDRATAEGFLQDYCGLPWDDIGLRCRAARIHRLRRREDDLCRLRREEERAWLLAHETQLGELQREEELLRAQTTVVDLKRAVFEAQQRAAHAEAEAARNGRRRCPLCAELVDEWDMFQCPASACQRWVCNVHKDVRFGTCTQCAALLAIDRPGRPKGQWCVLCGRALTQGEAFTCPLCHRAPLCVEACIHKGRRVCVDCADAGQKVVVESATGAGTDGVSPRLPAPQAALISLSNPAATFRIAIQLHTPTETARLARRGWLGVLAALPSETRADVPPNDQLLLRGMQAGSNPERGAFRLGDRISFSIMADRDCYVALLNVSANGDLTVLLPCPGRRDPLTRAGARWVLPDRLMLTDELVFRLDPPAGAESMVVLGSKMPLADMWQPDLWDGCEAGVDVSGAQAEALAARMVEYCRQLPGDAWAAGRCQFESSR